VLEFIDPPAKYPDEGTVVFKSGCSTGRTEGLINSVHEVRLAYAKDPKTGSIEKVATWEFSVADSRGSKFSAPGDSGSFVYDKAYAAIGLLTSGDERAGATSFTPLIDIFRDIKEVTGAVDVRLPPERRS
jgi:hypothetical protein